MNIDNPKGSEPSVSAQTKVRRTFLKRATAGAVLTSLPAHSVWGAVCSVSGAQSGNLSGIRRHKDCEKPELPEGRSPGYWKGLITSSENVHGAFTSVSNSGGPNNTYNQSVQACYVNEVTNVAKTYSMDIPSEFITPDFITNIYDSLMDEGHLDYNMAGVWLNAYFGFGGFTPGVASANKVVSDLIAYIIMQERSGNPVNAEGNAFFNFVEGTTSYQVTSCHSDPFEPETPEPI
ncbi:hypothetical protein [Paraglaciecola aestuariivivens]